MPEAPPDTPVVTLAMLLDRRRREGATVHFDVTEDWLQGRTTFGGLISVLGLQAMRDVAGADWGAEVALRALQTNFIGPVELGAVQAEVLVLREGRSVRQVQATLRQAGQTAALVIGVFGTDRTSSLPRHAPEFVEAKQQPDDVPRTLPKVGNRPSFARHFDMRWAEGTAPGSGTADWDARVHMRLTDVDTDRVPMEMLAVMFADATPSPASSHFTTPSPASSIAWSVELQPMDAGETGSGWWRTDNHVPAARGGYVNAQATLWTPAGRLAALSYQVVAVYG